jgi:hypothetical protein
VEQAYPIQSPSTLLIKMASTGDWDSLEETLAKLRTVPISTMSSEAEIELRTILVEILGAKFEIHSNPTDLYDAIGHVEAIIFCLPISSTKRPKYLNELSHMKMSAFEITDSMERLDESIACGKKARTEAEPINDPSLYKIYHNLGYSLSRRAQLGGKNPADLDEAIVCGRMVLYLAPPESTEYLTTVTNLALRLNIRYRRDHRTEDSLEAMALVARQQSSYPSGTSQHGMALVARAQIAYDLFQRTGETEDLDEALVQCKNGYASMPPGHEKTADIITLMSSLYESKYQQMGDPMYMRMAVEQFGLVLESTPANHEIRVDYLDYYLVLITNLAASTQSLSEIEDLIKQVKPLRERVPIGHDKRHSSGLSLGHLFARRYVLSRQLPYLIFLLSHAIKIC